MKKFKTGLLALALVFGVSAAVVAKVQAAPKVFEVNYDWDGNGPLLNGELEDRSIEQAQAAYGCSGSGPTCATSVVHGTTTPGPSIFQN